MHQGTTVARRIPQSPETLIRRDTKTQNGTPGALTRGEVSDVDCNVTLQNH